MGKLKVIILIAAAIIAGFYFKGEFAKFYRSSSWKISRDFSNFQKIDVNSLISQVKKEISAPLPLKIGGSESADILLKTKIIAETNLQRQQNGDMPPLRENSGLDRAAAAKANDMFLNQYFDHASPAGVDPGKLVQSFGYNYILTGENLILGNFSSEKEIVQNWMNSPGHRANILNERYTEIGVAIVKGTYKGETVWIGVQEFGLPLSACSEPGTALKNQINAYKLQLDSLSVQLDEKKAEINSVNSDSAAYRQIIDDYNKMVAQYNSLAEQVKKSIADYNNEAQAFNNCVSGKKLTPLEVKSNRASKNNINQSLKNSGF